MSWQPLSLSRTKLSHSLWLPSFCQNVQLEEQIYEFLLLDRIFNVIIGVTQLVEIIQSKYFVPAFLHLRHIEIEQCFYLILQGFIFKRIESSLDLFWKILLDDSEAIAAS